MIVKRIVKAHILHDQLVRLCFDDGGEGLVDFSTYPKTGVFHHWDDPEFFSQMKIAHQGRALAWPKEIDLCADSLWVEAGCGTPNEVFSPAQAHA